MDDLEGCLALAGAVLGFIIFASLGFGAMALALDSMSWLAIVGIGSAVGVLSGALGAVGGTLFGGWLGCKLK